MPIPTLALRAIPSGPVSIGIENKIKIRIYHLKISAPWFKNGVHRKIPAFDLVIADEAHRCAGKVGTDFSTILDNKLIRAKKRLFATATPRVYSAAVKTAAEGRGVEMVGMDDETLFGKVLYSLPFGKAISKNLLTDYQVIIIGVDNPMIAKWIKDRELLAIDPKNTMDAQALASQIGLLKAINDYDLKRVISFHSRVNRAESFVHDIQKVAAWVPKKHRPAGKLITDFVSGTMPTDKRRQKLERLKILAADERGILSNARCLSEGFDVPSLDGVAFIDPRASQVDIIQAVGRAIRLSTNKKIGTIVLPVFIEDGANAQASIEASNFKPIWDVLYALKAHDDVLSQELDQARTALGKQTLKKNKPSGLSKIVIDLPASVDSSFSDSLKTYLVEQVTESWNFWYGLLEEFVTRENHSRVPKDFKTKDKHNLGNWVSHQRSNKEKMSLVHKAQLELIKEWSWQPFLDQWEEGFEHLKEYVSKNKHSWVPADFVTSDNFKLGGWVSTQRMKRNNLLPDRKLKLELIRGWSWDILSDQWEIGFNSLKEFEKKENHTSVPRDFKTDKKFKLGNWVVKQRAKKEKLSLDRKNRLESISTWSWDPISEQWEEGYKQLEKFVKNEGHAKVSGSFVTTDGFKLGVWVGTQRLNNGKLTPNKLKRLTSLSGWSWDPQSEQWEEGFRQLVKFIKCEMHSRVPRNYKTPDGFNLGGWVVTQRTKKENMPPDRKKRLELLKYWSWDTLSDQWEKGFNYLKKFVKKVGNANVSQNFITDDGFNLGSWTSTQRLNKDKMSAERKKRLELLDGWVWQKILDQWEEGFKLLIEFIKEEKHARVPQSFKAKGGFNLGGWVTTQRSKRNKMSPDRKARLESLKEWIWDALADKWENGFQHLEKFVKKEKHAKVPNNFTTLDGFKLGDWVGNQRLKKAKLTSYRKEKLEFLPGWSWDVLSDQWEYGFKHLKEFVKRENHARVPPSFKTLNGFNLGSWVNTQRANKEKLSLDRKKRLEVLPEWKW